MMIASVSRLGRDGIPETLTFKRGVNVVLVNPIRVRPGGLS